MLRLHKTAQHRRRSSGHSEFLHRNFRVPLQARLPLALIGCCSCAPLTYWLFLRSLMKSSFSLVDWHFLKVFHGCWRSNGWIIWHWFMFCFVLSFILSTALNREKREMAAFKKSKFFCISKFQLTSRSSVLLQKNSDIIYQNISFLFKNLSFFLFFFLYSLSLSIYLSNRWVNDFLLSSLLNSYFYVNDL